MNPKTTVRLTVSSPRFGLFDKAIQVDNDVRQKEQEFIKNGAEELVMVLESWLHRGERVDAAYEVISEIGMAMRQAEGKQKK